MDYLSVHKLGRSKLATFPVKPKNNSLTTEQQFENTTFQATMKLPVLMGQAFGLNPVLGVTDGDSSKLRFKYFSGRSIYTYITIFGQVLFLNGFFLLKYFKDNGTSVSSNSKSFWLLEDLVLRRFVHHAPQNLRKHSLRVVDIVASSGTSLVFYLTNTTTTILFLRIALKWPKLCQHISSTEATDPFVDPSLARKCAVSCFVIMFLAMVEHGLSELSGFVTAADCNPDKIYETFIMHSFPWINHQLSYSPGLGALTQFLNIQCTFNWNFADLFVICISFYLTSRLEQINRKIAATKGRNVPAIFWRSVREDYNRVTDLVRRVDDVIGSIVFISFANNLFFICLQLLHTLADGIKAMPGCHFPDKRPLRGYEQPVYFTYSLIFLIVRSLAVCLIASGVHTASRNSVYTLYEVPSPVYCIEVQRFIEQINGQTVALSGLQFFKVKRGMVLAIAGTIVTYELVLLQFAGVTPTVTPLRSDDEIN